MSGYQDCECRDCFEIVCGDGMCHGCEDAGCEADAECQADHAYGGDEDAGFEPEPTGEELFASGEL